MRDVGRQHLRSPLSRRGLLLGGVISGVGSLAAAPGQDRTAPAAADKPSATGDSGTTRSPFQAAPKARPTSSSNASPSASTSGSRSVPTAGRSAPPDPAEVKANELGLVPVMMYHRIQPRITGEYDMTPADFRRQLQTLFAMGMRPVRTIDLVRGHFPINAGYTPVVLTFDDGYPNQFALDAAGTVDPDCALGILIDVCKQFPHCTPAGSLNINKNPFGLSTPHEQRRGLARLHELGFEIGNHTYNHDDLSRLDAGHVQEDFARLQHLVESAVPGGAVLTMALPFGMARGTVRRTGTKAS
jgi:hypothetical protein